MKTIRWPESTEEALALPLDEQRALFVLYTEALDNKVIAERRRALGWSLYENTVGPRGGRSMPQVLKDLAAIAGRPLMGKGRFHDLLHGRSGGAKIEPGSVG